MSRAAEFEAMTRTGLNFRYILPRLARHFMPEGLVRFFLRRGLIIRPGLETSDPQAAVERYTAALEEVGQALSGKRVLVFGYGGNFAVGVNLLRRGAAQVVLSDKYAPPDHARNRILLPEYSDYLTQRDGQVLPASESVCLLQEDIRQTAQQRQLTPVDFVLTSSVYEHLDDVPGTTRALVALTKPDGFHLHFIDLRDHFFKYPFEMLTYTERTWQAWLNPTSNLNRYRLLDYQRVFEQMFTQVKITRLTVDRAGYENRRRRIRPEFLSGDPEIDATTQIQVLACNSINPSQAD